jgi:NAD(P)-dependent dehydrogenase (short-subunit alcohol dehydrogenase family)
MSLARLPAPCSPRHSHARGVCVTAVAADITSEDGRRAVLAAALTPDILINNAGGPAASRFPKGRARRMDQRFRLQHADPDLTDPPNHRWHDRAASAASSTSRRQG